MKCYTEHQSIIYEALLKLFEENCEMACSDHLPDETKLSYLADAKKALNAKNWVIANWDLEEE